MDLQGAVLEGFTQSMRKSRRQKSCISKEPGISDFRISDIFFFKKLLYSFLNQPAFYRFTEGRQFIWMYPSGGAYFSRSIGFPGIDRVLVVRARRERREIMSAGNF